LPISDTVPIFGAIIAGVHAVDVNTVSLFKARLDRFWMNQDVKYDYDFTADLTRAGDRPVNEITEA